MALVAATADADFRKSRRFMTTPPECSWEPIRKGRANIRDSHVAALSG
jgi:hypothetical protein